MAQRIPVFVDASDPISQAGVPTQPRHRPEIKVVDQAECPQPVLTIGTVRTGVPLTDRLPHHAVRNSGLHRADVARLICDPLLNRVRV
jgi:hypothetical protein